MMVVIEMRQGKMFSALEDLSLMLENIGGWGNKGFIVWEMEGDPWYKIDLRLKRSELLLGKKMSWAQHGESLCLKIWWW